jgi:hypothetical protein
MKALKIVAVLLVAAGLFVVVYGGFNYPRSNRVAKLGSVEFAMKSQGRADIPEWAGIGAIILGTLMLLVPGKRR